MSDALNYLVKARPEAMTAYFTFLKKAGDHLDTRTRDLISVITKVAVQTEGGFRQYQTRLRMAESLERIREGAHLTDAALDLGFSSHSHFTERFRKTYGVAPSRYREMSRIEGWVINGA